MYNFLFSTSIVEISFHRTFKKTILINFSFSIYLSHPGVWYLKLVQLFSQLICIKLHM